MNIRNAHFIKTLLKYFKKALHYSIEIYHKLIMKDKLGDNNAEIEK